jgi:hypothetical protein
MLEADDDHERHAAGGDDQQVHQIVAEPAAARALWRDFLVQR